MSKKSLLALILSIFGPSARAKDVRPYPLLATTPPACQDLLYGKKYGADYDGLFLKSLDHLLSKRYDVTITGLDEILARGTEGMLIMPNHEGPIDPLIMLKAIGKRLSVRPVMTADMLTGPFKPVLKAGLNHTNGFLLPNPASGGQTAVGLTQAVFREIGNAVEHGDNVLIYPSGGIQIGPVERLGAKRGVKMLLEQNPNVRLILVRERGLWGSSWTHGGPEADPERRPTTGEVIARGVKTGARAFVKNFGGAMPKRPVSLTFFEATDFPRNGSVKEMNAYLEAFYNDDPEQRTLVSESRRDKGPHVRVAEEVIDYGRAKEMDGDDVASTGAKAETVRTVARLSRTELMLEEADEHTNLQELIDSLSKTNLHLGIEQELGVTLPDEAEYTTVGDLAVKVDEEAAHPTAVKKEGPRFTPSEGWLKNPSSEKRAEVFEGKTITSKVVRRALAEPHKMISEDTTGKTTYRSLLIRSLAISSVLEGLPGERLGMLMPASYAGPMFFMASHLAGKVPVMINFTSPPAAVLASLDSIGVKTILTSRTAVDRLGKAYDLSKIMDRFVYIEDLKFKILASLGPAVLNVRLAPRAVLARAELTSDAVILFTSGSSGTPKAVPLTHANILANVADVTERFNIHESDRLLTFLPPFHSFGNLLQILSLTLGVPAVYHPNPQEAQKLVDLIEAYGPTIVVGTPTLLDGLAKRGTVEKLKSTRLLVAGAEALKPSIHERLAAKFPSATIIEGYGTTEMSPVVAANPPEDSRLGSVGKIVSSLQHKIVNAETHEEVAPGEVGTLLVTGPSMFRGYLNTDADPFVTLADGLRYYNTEDLVKDEGGYIKIAGRLSRYRKIHGEMVSLPEMEDALDQLAEPQRPKGDDGEPVSGPMVVVESIGDNAPLVLFTAVDLTQRQVTEYMRGRGFSGVRTISEVRKVDAIPMLGTGKADYKTLQGMLK